MRPIEQVHRQILAGNVLDSSGVWIPRAEALKQKRVQLKHILSGEVEIDGIWVKLSTLDVKASKQYTEIKEKYPVDADRFSAIRQHISQSSAPEIKSVSPFSAAEPPPQEEKTVVQPIPAVPESKNEPVSAAVETPQQNVSPDVIPQPEKQTITIRTIPLGKETMLTISESRAGNALVAISSIQGFIDQTNADELNAQLMSMLEFGVRFFIIDFEHTNLIGSAGWGILAVASRLIKASQGHLLLCSMSPDIEESFLLLQFNEVIDAKKDISECLDAIDAFLTEQKNSVVTVNEQEHSIFPQYGESFEDLPLNEKIKTVISRNGPSGFFALLRHLRSSQYGSTKIGMLKFYFTLRELNLESKWKRVRFYRSC